MVFEGGRGTSVTTAGSKDSPPSSGAWSREGDARVRHPYSDENGFRLGYWVVSQRTAYGRGELSSDRASRLAALPGWTWRTRSSTCGSRGSAPSSGMSTGKGTPASLSSTERVATVSVHGSSNSERPIEVLPSATNVSLSSKQCGDGIWDPHSDQVG